MSSTPPNFTTGLLFSPSRTRRQLNQNPDDQFPNYCQITLDGATLLANDVLVFGAKLSNGYHCHVDTFERVTTITKEGLSKTKKKLRLKLPWGHSVVEFQKKEIHVYNMRFFPPLSGKRDNGVWLIEITLVTVHGRKHLVDFIKAAKKDARIKKTANDVIVYVQNDGYWPVLNKLPKRPLTTIYLDHDIKENLVADVKKFLESETLYQRFGIPYKRNYLFSGKPGLGKSSLIFALASHFDLNVGIMSFGNRVDDTLFMYALSHLPERTILVLEDIDCLFVKRDKQKDSHNHLTFSGLLNGLDGIARRHGLLTFMTTNHPERLDSALIRPGRVDYRVEFQEITNGQIKTMFTELVPTQTGRIKEFIQKVRVYRDKLTPAALQQFLFRHKDITSSDNIIEFMDSELRDICCGRRDREKQENSMHMVYL